MESSTAGQPLAELSLLSDPVRRRLYDIVAAHQNLMSRQSVSKAAGVSRALTAYHLDKLAEAGLLDISYARHEGRTGPGAGRPAKWYTRAQEEVSVSLPPRNYGLLAQILTDAVDADSSNKTRLLLASAAEQHGRALGAQAVNLGSALVSAGYEPVTVESDDIILRNCPFHRIMQHNTEIVCNLNRSVIQGTLAGTGNDPERAELSPAEGRCCVVIHSERETHRNTP